uniref:CCHC-type domain-containing protein n=1 Tax=Electrophorus electricus TaxID=8005 RepID=A0AAY5EDW9_ELEEL
MRESGSREQPSTAQPSTAQSSSWWVGSVPSVGSGTLSSARARATVQPTAPVGPVLRPARSSGYRFSAFWLRSSVVSVLISLDFTTDLHGFYAEENSPAHPIDRRTPYSIRPAEGGPPRTREAASVGDQALPRLQDRPEMATAEAGMAPRSTAQAAEAPAKTPTAGRASLAEPGLRAGSGLLNTARFRWRDPQDGTCFTERVLFIREVLFGGFGLDPGALICAQRNGAQKFFDVTFASDAIYRRVLELGDGMGGHPVGKNFVLEPLWDGDRRMVTIHFFNPHVSAAEVRRFLTMYGEVLPSERMVRDELGIWNGRRQFLMKFGRNSEGQERYPPAYFTYAGNRGYLFFRGQPAFCRGCQRYGHLAEGCQDCECRNCLGPGHQAKDCKNPRRCRDCRGEGHMSHSCPKRVRSYATVLAGDPGH